MRGESHYPNIRKFLRGISLASLKRAEWPLNQLQSLSPLQGFQIQMSYDNSASVGTLLNYNPACWSMNPSKTSSQQEKKLLLCHLQALEFIWGNGHYTICLWLFLSNILTTLNHSEKMKFFAIFISISHSDHVKTL